MTNSLLVIGFDSYSHSPLLDVASQQNNTLERWHDLSADQKYWTPLIPELRGRSTGSMVTNFVLGLTVSHEILAKLRRPFGTASASISLKFHSKMLPKNKLITLATAAVRLSRPSEVCGGRGTKTKKHIEILYFSIEIRWNFLSMSTGGATTPPHRL